MCILADIFTCWQMEKSCGIRHAWAIRGDKVNSRQHLSLTFDTWCDVTFPPATLWRGRGACYDWIKDPEMPSPYTVSTNEHCMIIFVHNWGIILCWKAKFHHLGIKDEFKVVLWESLAVRFLFVFLFLLLSGSTSFTHPAFFLLFGNQFLVVTGMQWTPVTLDWDVQICPLLLMVTV